MMATTATGFLKLFTPEACVTSLQDAAIRQALHDAILLDNRTSFCDILCRSCPDFCNEHRIFGVLIERDGLISPVLVDETGRRLDSEDIIDAKVPIELLNVKVFADRIEAMIGDEKWMVPT